MAHFKKYSEHRHGRDIAKSRVGDGHSGTSYDLKRLRDSGMSVSGIPGRKTGGRVPYDSGGVVKFPSAGREDLQRLRSSQGVESGRIPGVHRDNVVAGPGRNRVTGGIKRNWLDRQSERDEMVYAKGGKVSSAIKSEIASAIKKHDAQLHGEGKHTKLARGGRLTGGGDSGVGRMERARLQASRRGK